MKFVILLYVLCWPLPTIGFTTMAHPYKHTLIGTTQLHATTAVSPSFSQSLLDFALQTPLWKYFMVPQARSKMIQTAESNGILWKRAREWIRSKFVSELDNELDTSHIPSYYRKPFHAYHEGNLSWDAAFEAELASCAVGARNVPLEGKNGENAFRTMFEVALEQAGATLSSNGVIVDLGCSTGMSTRRLAQRWPMASQIIGIDMSPYFVEVGKKLLQLEPKSSDEGGPWVSSIHGDDRIFLRVGNIQQVTGISNVDVAQLQFVAHELPPSIAQQVVDEAFRILKPGGQFWMCEMDFEAPAYAAQRANPLLFCLIRATEPYLDDYADSAAELRQYIASKFSVTKVVAATGRHYALVATKGEDGDATGGGVLEDLRFNPDGTYGKEDTHLKVWENKQEKYCR